MIKTLRITSIIAVVLAAVFFAFPAVFGVRGDKQIEQFLNSASVIEKFKEAKGNKVEDSQREISPLVKQAEVFALYLNPPPKPSPAPSVPEVKSEPRPAGPVTAKFKLVGTSRHVLQPELSLALIDEPGKGLHWVRQLSKVDHLIIEQVRDGLVVVRDGTNTFELVVERPEKRSLLKANPSGRREASPSGVSHPQAESGGRITDGKLPEINAEVQVSAEEKEMTEAEMKKALAELDAMLASAKQGEAGQAEAKAAQEDVEVGETDSGSNLSSVALAKEEAKTEAKEIAAGKRSTSDLETMRISAREARGLGRLGRRLKNVQREPNRAENNITKSDANGVSRPQADLIEPNGVSRP